MQVTKKELTKLVAEAVERVALTSIQSGSLPMRDERQFIVQDTVDRFMETH